MSSDRPLLWCFMVSAFVSVADLAGPALDTVGELLVGSDPSLATVLAVALVEESGRLVQGLLHGGTTTEPLKVFPQTSTPGSICIPARTQRTRAKRVATISPGTASSEVS